MGSPNIRFSRFSDDWEQRKLGELYSERNEKGNDSLEILSVSIHTGVSDRELDEDNLGKFVRRSKDKTTYKHVYSGDLIFNMMRAWQGAIGVAKSEGMISPAYISAIPSKGIYPLFMDYALRRKEAIEQIDSLSYGVTDFRKRLYWDSFVNVKCSIPSISEQQKIWEFFKSIDNLITLHQRKCDETKEVKKVMLQRMFPRNGEIVPEIRFAGFTDDWEQRKFGDIAMRESLSKESSDDYPFVEYEDVVAEEGRLNKDIRQKEGSKKGIVFDGSQVLYGKLRPYLHNWLNPDFSGVAVGDWWVLKPQNANKNFVYRLIQTQQFDDVANQSAGSKMPRADWNLVSNTEFSIPTSYDEQKKIGEYFESLDNLITLHQRKCDEMKEMKQYMLRNMFPQKG